MTKKQMLIDSFYHLDTTLLKKFMLTTSILVLINLSFSLLSLILTSRASQFLED